MGIEFKKIETDDGKTFLNDMLRSLSCQHIQVVPDLTGDGIPDYLTATAADKLEDITRCKQNQKYGKMWLMLSAGAIKDGKLAPTAYRTIFATPTFIRETRSGDKPADPNYAPIMIRDPQVQDYNGDGLMDISFYLYVYEGYIEGFDAYQRILLLAEKKPEVRAAK